MHFLENFYLKTLQYELANKYFLKNTKEIPKFKKIVLNFSYWGRQSGVKILASSMLALELTTDQRGRLTKTCMTHISIKLKKGVPVGCKLILQKNNNFEFLARIIQEALPSGKVFTLFKPNRVKNAFSFKISEVYSFSELEQRYHFFTELGELGVTIVLDTKSEAEVRFILGSLQLPLKT
jgi:large subunit ribosomal protein L5